MTNREAELRKIKRTIDALGLVIYCHVAGDKTDPVTKAEYLIDAANRIQDLAESGVLESLLNEARGEGVEE